MELKTSTPSIIYLYKTKDNSLAVITYSNTFVGDDDTQYTGYIISKNGEGIIEINEGSWNEQGKYLNNVTYEHLNIVDKCTSVKPYSPSKIYNICSEMFEKLGYSKQLLLTYDNAVFDSNTGAVVSSLHKLTNTKLEVETKEETEKEEEEFDIKKEFPAFNVLIVPFLFTLLTVLFTPILIEFTFKYALEMHLHAPNDAVTTFWYYVALVFAVIINSAYTMIGGISITVLAFYFFQRTSTIRDKQRIKKESEKGN